MKLVCISDTHSLHKQLPPLPDGDVLIHAGDFSSLGYLHEVRNFTEWFQSQPHKHKIFIAGNHDGMPYKEPALFREVVKEYAPDVIYLENSGVELEGVKFYGSPITPTFFNWYFMKNRGLDIKQVWNAIPMDTQVLITHGPPWDTLDECPNGDIAGCEELRAKVDIMSMLKAHIFGHIHGQHGIFERNNTLYVNASSCTENYLPRHLPHVITI